MISKDDFARLKNAARRRQILGEIPKRIIPLSHWGDVTVGLIRFICRHRRFPGHRNLWNNHIFRLKSSGELRSPLRARITDKEHVKQYIDEKLGTGYAVPTIAILQDCDALRTYRFPPDCCIKPTHSCGKVIIRHTNALLSYAEMISWFFHNHYMRGREPNYRHLTPKIIVEPLLFEEQGFTEYRFYCVDREVRGIWVETGRFGRIASALYSLDFRLLYQWKGGWKDAEQPQAPACLKQMLRAAHTIAQDFNFIRIDMYSDGSTFFVGELTSCDGNALARYPSIADEALASYYIFGGVPDRSIARSSFAPALDEAQGVVAAE